MGLFSEPALKVAYKRIDHVAVAVRDLEQAILFYQNVLKFTLEERRTTQGQRTGMISAVMNGGNFTIVLIQGLQPESQVSQYIQNYGPGVQHVALEVENLEEAADMLRSSGMSFATDIISGSGLKQIFSNRDPNSGVMVEIIERCNNLGFEEGNVQNLFDKLEAAELV